MTEAGRRIVWGGSLLALAFDVLVRVVPLIPPLPRMTPHRLLVFGVLAGVPLLQGALAQAARTRPQLRWALIPISAVWLVAAVLLMWEASVLFLPAGGLWIAGAVDTPPVRR